MGVPSTLTVPGGAPLLRRKTKTGCRTCKIRKIKCDETWPACNCCVNTGRTCDGYGIWGGGGKQRPPSLIQQLPKRSTKVAIPKARPVSLIGVATAEEKSYFEFYIARTANKLPPAFGTSFHHSVVLRASSSEPAVLHALLALSASHQRKEMNMLSKTGKHMLPDKHEKFMLQQYSKAIQHLNALPDDNSSSIRTTLTTCLVFIYIEYLRGDYAVGLKHLQCGLRLIQEIKQERSPRAQLSAKELKISARFPRALDEALVTAFERQHIVADYASRYDPNRARLPSDLPMPLPKNAFISIEEAIHYIKETFTYVENGTKEHEILPGVFSSSRRKMFEDDKPILRGHLDFWMNMYINTLREVAAKGDKQNIQAYKTLRPYQSMTTILVAISFIEHTEMIFDDHITAFLTIVNQSIDLMDTGGPSSEVLERLKKLGWNSAKSINDSGRIPPLYFTALKCRNHRIRHCALQLLQLQSLEGTLEPYYARVAEEVVRLEEGDYFSDRSEGSDAMLQTQGIQEYFPLPESRRMVGVDVVIPGDGSDEIQLVCKQKTEGGWLYTRESYDPLSACWMQAC